MSDTVDATNRVFDQIGADATTAHPPLTPRGQITARELAAWKSAADIREQRIRAEITAEIEASTADVTNLLAAVRQDLRAQIAAEIEAFADDHSDVSDAYRHAALIAKGTPGP